ncbi:MAG: hypothetical protein H7123_02865, partial [Thermoleophilia bacterium]|nr:hypothetical protein [Thermoleophilia bacterium]
FLVGQDGDIFVKTPMSAPAGAVFDYAPGVEDWSAGTKGGFGVCLKQVATGALLDVSTWATTGSCTAVIGDPWKPLVANAAAAGSKVAYTASGTLNANVKLRFGLRTATDQTPGEYSATVVFETIAPNV